MSEQSPDKLIAEAREHVRRYPSHGDSPRLIALVELAEGQAAVLDRVRSLITDMTYADDFAGTYTQSGVLLEALDASRTVTLMRVKAEAWSAGNLAGAEGYFETHNPFRSDSAAL